MTEPVNNQWIELLNGLDKISEYNKLGGRGHGDLADTCYICGISPSILKAAILSKLESTEQEAEIHGQMQALNSFHNQGIISGISFKESIKQCCDRLDKLKGKG